MSESPAKKVSKKKPAAKKPAAHPKYSVMIVEAIKALKSRKGTSRQQIASYIKANFKVGESSTPMKLALKRLVADGTVTQVKGTGFSGSFKLVAAPAAKPKAKKPAAKKPAAKKTAAKKTPKKVAKKPAKKSATKKPSSAKKAKKPAAKKPAAKKATKKTPKKKAPAKKAAKK